METHLIIIPSYNTGEILKPTVEAAVQTWGHTWVVIDGSTDDSSSSLDLLCADYPNLRILKLAENQGKGAAVLHGARLAAKEGYTHILTMDADGQHPTEAILPALERSRTSPEAVIMGQPIFGDDVPLERFYFRKLNNFWTAVETLGAGLGDTLFGMRVYPLDPFVDVMEKTAYARGFDFDPEISVRLVWAGFQPIQLKIPVRYLQSEEGGVSHFHYVRDNMKLIFLHLRLLWRWITGGAYKSFRNKRRWRSQSS